MAEIIFHYYSFETNIQCQTNEKMAIICNRFANKIEKDLNSFYFIYNGEEIKMEFTFIEQANEIDKKSSLMNILAYEKEKEKDKDKDMINSNFRNSKEVICPKCEENAILCYKDYKVILYGCTNKHIYKIPLIEYEKTQIIDQSKIKCSNCNNNKGNVHNYEFYKCFTCKINLCPLCKCSHNKEHKITNYDTKNFKCHNHNEIYNSFCKICEKNLCILCEKNHYNPEIIYFGSIIKII